MSRRTERLGEELRVEIAQMIAGDLRDPRIGLVTVTRVDLTPDLGTARVYVGVAGSRAERDKSLAALRRAATFLRRSLAQSLRLRHTPEIVFHYDAGLDATERVAKLLDEIHATTPGGADDDDGAGGGDEE